MPSKACWARTPFALERAGGLLAQPDRQPDRRVPHARAEAAVAVVELVDRRQPRAGQQKGAMRAANLLGDGAVAERDA